MGYQSRVPLGALKQEALRSSIAFTPGLFETHKFVHLLIKPVPWDAHLYTLDVTRVEWQYLSHSHHPLLELLVGEIELLQTHLGSGALWRIHHSTHIQVLGGILQFKAFVLISAAIAPGWLLPKYLLGSLGAWRHRQPSPYAGSHSSDLFGNRLWKLCKCFFHASLPINCVSEEILCHC